MSTQSILTATTSSLPPYDFCAKLERAVVHVRNLADAVNSFVGGGAYGIEVVLDPNTREYIVRGRVRKDAPFREWGLLIGDAVNNLRSALDNLVWQLTILQQGSPPADPLPYNSRWRDVRFPIIIKPASWAKAAGKNLWGIRPSLSKNIEALQPFVTGKNAPEREPLVVLEELWNIDKHRHLHLTVCFVGLDDVLSSINDSPMWPKAFRHGYKILSKQPSGPIEDGAELGRITHGNTILSIPPQMDVKASLAFDVAFDHGPPAYGGRVIETLGRLSETVLNIIGQFHTEFPA